MQFRIHTCSCIAVAVVSPHFAAASNDVVVVTGERREKLATETPASISVIGRAEIDRIGADHPSELLNRIPGVAIQRGSGQEHLTSIRSPVLTGGAGAGSFLYLENGVPLRSAGFANVNGLFEAHSEIAERIEVQRGPSGALYGSNAIHGVVNVISPSPNSNRSFIEGSVDTIGRLKSRGVASHLDTDGGVVAGFSVLDDPGFRTESGADEQKITLRVDRNSGDVRTATIFSFINLNQETAGFVEGANAYRDVALRRINPNPEAFRDAKALRLSTRVEIDLGERSMLSVTPFIRWNDMDFLLHFLPSKALEENSHWSIGSQNVLYLDSYDAIQLIVGVDWEYTEGELSEFQSLPQIFSYTTGLHYDYDVAAFSLAPFVSATAQLAPSLKAIIAGRLDHTRYNYDNLTDDGVVGRFLRPSDRIDDFTTFSPKFSLMHVKGPRTFYASLVRGARPPQATDLYRLQTNQTTDPAKPETIDSAEIGWRQSLADRLQFELAAYYMRKRNFYFRDADGFNVSDGRTRHVGGEFAMSFQLADGLSLDAQTSYARHTYRFDRPVLSLPQASETIMSGDDIDTAPRWLGGASLSWRPESAPVAVSLDWEHVGSYFMDASNSVKYEGHDILDARAELELRPKLLLFASIRNIANSFYATRADFAFGNERYFPGEGRVATFGMRLER